VEGWIGMSSLDMRFFVFTSSLSSLISLVGIHWFQTTCHMLFVF
jgi:hypothetical protein